MMQYRTLQLQEAERITASDCDPLPAENKRRMDCAKKWAKAQGAEKLYISAPSSVESQAFSRPWDAPKQRNSAGFI